MRSVLLPVHIIAGTLGMLSGFVAVWASQRPHCLRIETGSGRER